MTYPIPTVKLKKAINSENFLEHRILSNDSLPVPKPQKVLHPRRELVKRSSEGSGYKIKFKHDTIHLDRKSLKGLSFKLWTWVLPAVMLEARCHTHSMNHGAGNETDKSAK